MGVGALTCGHAVGRAIAPHDCSHNLSRLAEGCHRGLLEWARATRGMRLIGEMDDLHLRGCECLTIVSLGRFPIDAPSTPRLDIELPKTVLDITIDSPIATIKAMGTGAKSGATEQHE